MYKIRTVKYSEQSVSVQVYIIENRKRKIIKHIGTARSEDEKANLIVLAQDFIQKLSKQLALLMKQAIRFSTFLNCNITGYISTSFMNYSINF